MILFVIFLSPKIVSAQSLDQVAVVYMTDGDSVSEEVVFWEAQLSNMANEVTLHSVYDVQSINEYDALLFIGETKGVVPIAFQEMSNNYPGQLIAMGYNAEQLSLFKEWSFGNDEIMRGIEGQFLPFTSTIHQVQPPSGSRVLATATILEGEIPFIVKKGRISYIATTSIGQQEVFAVAKHFPKLLETTQTQTHLNFLVLNQISPFMDIQLIERAAKTVLASEIPLYLSVKPAIINRTTGEEIRLEADKKMLEILKDLQAQGAYIIVEGYNQTYRNDEVKNNTEFWDALFDQPITKNDMSIERVAVSKEEGFRSRSEYEEARMQEIEEETTYIQHKLTAAIDELVKEGLYPLAFKVPDNAMSTNGYAVTSNYFTSLFGRLQLSDETQFSKQTPLFVTKPAKLNGMTLYPYTLPAIDERDPTTSLVEVEQVLDQLEEIPGAVIGGSIPVSLDAQHLQSLIHMISKVEGSQWLDLNTTSQVVETESYQAIQNPGEALQYTSKFSKSSQLWRTIKERPFEASLWGMAFVVLVFIIGFFINISTLRIRLRKRLFEEREQNG